MVRGSVPVLLKVNGRLPASDGNILMKLGEGLRRLTSVPVPRHVIDFLLLGRWSVALKRRAQCGVGFEINVLQNAAFSRGSKSSPLVRISRATMEPCMMRAWTAPVAHEHIDASS